MFLSKNTFFQPPPPAPTSPPDLIWAPQTTRYHFLPLLWTCPLAAASRKCSSIFTTHLILLIHHLLAGHTKDTEHEYQKFEYQKLNFHTMSNIRNAGRARYSEATLIRMVKNVVSTMFFCQHTCTFWFYRVKGFSADLHPQIPKLGILLEECYS